MAEHFHGRMRSMPATALLALAVVGLLTSLGIDRVPAAAPDQEIPHQLPRRPLAADWIDAPGPGAVSRRLGNTYFWFLGSLLFSTIVVYGPDVLHIGQTKTGYLNAALAVGIGIGSMIAGLVSGNKIEYGLIPLGSIGMTVHRPAPGRHRTHGLFGSAVLLGVLGFWAGFFAVPVNALIQHRPGKKDKGGIIAAANLAVLRRHRASSGVYYIFTAVHSSQSRAESSSPAPSLPAWARCMC
jgi:acyl-[acyl-carrier-protein]-phospholipid O-acyltransferase/long-chain-fatty-acid--[acyl-carrier-protein] ligase